MELARFRFPVAAKGDVERYVLWFHGGGSMMGSPEASLPESAVLAKWTRGEVTLPRYRLAPEHPFPAAFDDAVMAARSFLDVHDPAVAVFAGDSAGAALALSAACALATRAGRCRPRSTSRARGRSSGRDRRSRASSPRDVATRPRALGAERGAAGVARAPSAP